MTLASRYLGLDLKTPLIASASPLTLELDNIRALEDHGAGAVVLPSIFEEQLDAESDEYARLAAACADSVAGAQNHFLAPSLYRTGTHRYLETLRQARAAVDIPVIASLNGVTSAGWTSYARDLEQAGASAIELNVFFIPADLAVTGPEVEARYRHVLRAVKSAVAIPVAIKLSPYFSAPGAMVRSLDDAGADGCVLFNRFYQPDIDLVAMRLLRDLQLSAPTEIRLPLLWIGILAGQVRGSLAASSGVETADEVVKFLLVGADAVMTTSALLRHGVGHMRVLRDGLAAWLDARDATVGDIRGRMSQRRVQDPTAFERANYIRILQGWAGDGP
ncbi:dihydroorotate dehydrogenase-like protein [Limobrevibacterium gyesilva]|uniref:Dihydroorotate dehydrogenase-like protein n=1 Tax=Limobrevibacterium gyesilva TaxID=2991712 RepID=A0AA41YR95_9PROT|nr:dihydroorotate dehydrogenase-like protein [Limobrevibacterium gyesilva]MCW3475045.1 dihydroorotate dehydrogenase-like protein [Limobrevibacterium gyesilva]